MSDNDAQAIIEAAREIGQPRDLNPEVPQAIIVPEGDTLSIPDLRAWRSRPTRKTGTYRPANVESFLDYGKAHETDATTVWVHPSSGKIIAVLNDNEVADSGWADHRLQLDLQTTPEWNYWNAKDGAMMCQTDFAEHVEGGLDEIEEPEAATVLEIAQSFHATSSAAFRSSTRLQSGEQRLQYDESIDAKAGASGDLTVPTMILLGIAPFIGEDRYKLAARFRFRLSAGKLTLGYKLDRPDRVKRDAIEKIAERLTEEFARVYIGEPASASAGLPSGS